MAPKVLTTLTTYITVGLLMCHTVSSPSKLDKESQLDMLDSLNLTMSSDQQHLSARQSVIQDMLRDYDPKVSPDFEKDTATVVTVQVFIVGFDSISEATMDYAMSIFLRQSWTDTRLQHQPLPGLDKLELDSRVMKQIWVPDLYFTNEKSASFHDVTVPNKLMHVSPEGQVLYSIRLSMTATCDMFLQKFPFDAQNCHLSMESYSYSVKNLVFTWHPTPVLTRPNLKLPQFDLLHVKHSDCTKEYTGAGKYTCIRLDFHLSRNYGYYVAQVFVPTVLIVILSWVSFWLDIHSVPARISLGLLTVLTMTTQSVNARAHLPRVSYIKAIDVWMATCLFFVFAALIEFAYVNVNARVEKRRSSQAAAHGGLRLGVGGKGPANSAVSESEDDKEGKPKRLFSKTTISRAKARRLDKISRFGFPAAFAVFNLVYWLFYMFWEPHTES